MVLRVKMISAGSEAPMKARIRSRTASKRSVASTESVCTPRWMLEFMSR